MAGRGQWVEVVGGGSNVVGKKSIVGFHMTSLKFKLKTIDPTKILLSRCIRAAEN